MRKTVIRLLTALILLALVVTGIVFASSAEPEPSNTKLGSQASLSLFSTAGKKDPQNGGTGTWSGADKAAAMEAGTLHMFFEFDYLQTAGKMPSGFTAFIRTSSGNNKAAIASITDGHVSAEGPLTYSQFGWDYTAAVLSGTYNIGWFGGTDAETITDLFRCRKKGNL